MGWILLFLFLNLGWCPGFCSLGIHSPLWPHWYIARYSLQIFFLRWRNDNNKNSPQACWARVRWQPRWEVTWTEDGGWWH
jgi:hypothetical protein